MRIGPVLNEDGSCDFTVWAPEKEHMRLDIVSPYPISLPMSRDNAGYWRAHLPDAPADLRYRFTIDSTLTRPDPASHFQPEGVHGPSQVVDHSRFAWTDGQWKGIPLDRYIIYEMHTGTFSPQGTFRGAIEKLPYLLLLGVNALEIMPVAQFPGERNWGYDGVYSYAVQNSYGGPDGLKQLVNECHRQGMAVILDVVYNHFGPEGSYHRDYGPYFTTTYKTPWGDAINFDEALSDPVRDFFIENALFWLDKYHIDALRLDAIHGIYDRGARHFLEQLSEAVDAYSSSAGRQYYLIAESDLNDTRVIRSRETGGYGIHAQWSDDWHHSVHALLTGEDTGYYGDFGGIDHLRKAYAEGFVYSWTYSRGRTKHHGSSSAEFPGSQFVVCTQNHDQVGNRVRGERLSHLVPFEACKLAAGALLVAPNIPLLFMGQEYAESAPFPYFVSHSDPDLVEAVRVGRRNEFKHNDFSGDVPDPQAEETFLSAKLDWQLALSGIHEAMLSWYKELIRVRRMTPALANLDKKRLGAALVPETKLLVLSRWLGGSRIVAVMNFAGDDAVFRNATGRELVKQLDSADTRWAGPGGKLPTRLRNEGESTVPGYCFGLFKALD